LSAIEMMNNYPDGIRLARFIYFPVGKEKQ
jgi:hypothetical protein